VTDEPSLALQKAIRARLIDTPAVADIVPADNIIDGTARPENFPCVIIGDGQTVLEGATGWHRSIRVYSDIHVWAKGSGLEAVKMSAGTVWAAISDRLIVPGFLIADGVKVTGTRYLRDPSGDVGHAIVSVEAVMGQSL
jgi:hypothetical protein